MALRLLLLWQASLCSRLLRPELGAAVVVVPELLPLRARGRGMGLATTFNWIGIYMIVLLFPMLLDLGASPVFLFFVVTNVAGFAFAFATLTETSRISLEQLELGPH